MHVVDNLYFFKNHHDHTAKKNKVWKNIYNFTYIAANLVLVEVNAYISTGTVATDATASVTGGI